jgi:signal peptidase I
MIALWLAFAPRQAGGLASYIIVIGNSMEPGFHIGDLVILHEEARYEVGDAVVYRNLELESYVFHRIIEQRLGRFILKGDNNAWTDAYQPTHGEVLGKLWLRIPNGGSIIRWIRNPFVMAAMAGITGGILVTGIFSGRSKGRKQMNREWFATIRQKIRERWLQPDGGEPPRGGMLSGLVFALGLVAFASLLLGIISFLQPATRLAQNDIQYKQLGFFAYAASTPQGVYDANSIQSGDPIFPQLTCSVDLTFRYTLVAQQAEMLSGTYQLTATISERTSGWRRTVPLQGEGSFSGNAFGTSAKLDLCMMEKLAQSMEQNTDFHPGSYTVTISPNVKVDGEVSGLVLQDSFNQGLEFRYDRVQFHLTRDEEQANPLNMLAAGVLSEVRTDINTLRLFGAEFAVPALRWIAVLGLVASLGGLATLGMRLQNLSKRDPAQFIRARFGPMMIGVRNAEMLESSAPVDVSSIDDLGKLAERFNAVILHAETGRSHAYYVRGEGTSYRFVMDSRETGSTVPAEEAERDL